MSNVFKTLSTAPEQIAAVQGVLERLIGDSSQKFSLEIVDTQSQYDFYEYQIANDKVTLRGSTGIALSRGAYDLLRQIGHVHCSQEGNNVNLPDIFPDTKLTRVDCPYKHRNFYNQCTFGYTSAYWDWERWQVELDWLALHGIDLPLAMVGQESIWRMVWQEMGFSIEQIDAMFTGPAFLPWHRMGNIYAHNGNVPEAWHQSQIDLQIKIISRMRELGMQPVAPGFAGYVPKAFNEVFPEADVKRMKAFADFDNECDSYCLGAQDPMFSEIGGRFIRKYKEIYGPVSFYLVDSFNEMIPPVSKEGRYEELAEYGLAGLNSVKAGDPDGMWVMQGWMFSFDRKFWDNKSVEAFFSKIPDDQMIVLDLECSRFPMWQDLEAFYGKQWAYSIVHNFGATNFPFGDLHQYSTSPIEAYNSDKKGNHCVFGIVPEGSENNAVAYELLFDMSWRKTAPDLTKWLHEYCEDRYGACPAQIDLAWQSLLKTVYQMKVLRAQRYMRRPSLLSDATPPFDHDELGKAIKLYLEVADQFADNDLFLRDLADFVLVYMGNVADNKLVAAFRSQLEHKNDVCDQYLNQCFDIVRQLDTMLETRPQQKLSRLINNSRKFGKTEQEADYYESDGKMMITVWGGPILADYAARAWSGVIRDFYIPRLTKYIELVRTEGEEAATKGIAAWENEWYKIPGISQPPATPENIIDFTRNMFENADALINLNGEPVGQWNPDMLVEEVFQDLDWDISNLVTKASMYTANFQCTDAYHYLFIDQVSILEDGVEVANEKHEGYCGNTFSKNNIYPIELKEFKNNAKYTLRVHAKGWQGTYCYGNVSLKKA